MNDLSVAYELGVLDRRKNKFVRKLELFTNEAVKEYSRGWIDQWQAESRVRDVDTRVQDCKV